MAVVLCAVWQFPKKNKLEVQATVCYLPEVILNIQFDEFCDALIACVSRDFFYEITRRCVK